MLWTPFIAKQGIYTIDGKYYSNLLGRFLTLVEVDNLYQNYNWHYGSQAQSYQTVATSSNPIFGLLLVGAVLFALGKD